MPIKQATILFDMLKRRKSKAIAIGTVKIGSGRPVAIQSMTKVATTDRAGCIRQIKSLIRAGCQLVRLAVPTRADTAAFAEIVQKIDIPLIADVHFSSRRAVEAIEAGAAKIRLNPGNIKRRQDIYRIIDAAKMHKTAVRIGINEASIRDLRKKDVPVQKRVGLMLREMKRYVSLFENRKFNRLVLSAKSSDVSRTIEINRLIAKIFDYPIHLGLTHAGLSKDALIPSAVALGALLAEGIGDTIRVSVAGSPVGEVKIAKRILMALGLYERHFPEFIVCPTCARAQVDVAALAGKVRKKIANFHKPLRVAVMGCIVNGPGEAADADLAICAAKKKVWIYRRGKRVSIVSQQKVIPAILQQLEKL